MNRQQRLAAAIHALDAIDSGLQAFLVDLASSQSYAHMTDVIRLRQHLAIFRKDLVEVFDDIED